MVKSVRRYKGKVYVNEVNYSAGVLMARVYKNTADFKVGDIYRIVFRSKSDDSKIHLERIPLQDKVRIAKIHKYTERPSANSKYLGYKLIHIDIEQILNIIENSYGNREFSSIELTMVLRRYSFNFEKLQEFQGIYTIKRFETYDCLKGLCDRGYLKYKNKNYHLLKNPIIADSLHGNCNSSCNNLNLNKEVKK